MAEFEVYVCEDYQDDVWIDMSNLNRKEKAKLINAIMNNEEYRFKDVDLHYEGDTYVEIEPADWR